MSCVLYPLAAEALFYVLSLRLVRDSRETREVYGASWGEA